MQAATTIYMISHVATFELFFICQNLAEMILS